MKCQNNRGFTLIEVIVVAAIIAILAGILIPMIFNQIDESKISRANGDTKSIMSSIQTFKKDSGKWPIANSNVGCAENVDFIGDVVGGAAVNLPTGFPGGWMMAGPTSLAEHLVTNACYPSPPWKGPYMTSIGLDPWGHSYVINADSFSIAGNSVWVLSAGPTGAIQTGPTDTAVQGDDIGFRIK